MPDYRIDIVAMHNTQQQLAAASDRVEQEAGNTRPSMFGVALRYTVANAPPERSGVNVYMIV